MSICWQSQRAAGLTRPVDSVVLFVLIVHDYLLMKTGSGELSELKYHERRMLYYVVLKHQTIEGAMLI